MQKAACHGEAGRCTHMATGRQCHAACHACHAAIRKEVLEDREGSMVEKLEESFDVSLCSRQVSR